MKFTEKSLKIYSLLSYTAWTPYLIVLRVEKKKEIRSVQYNQRRIVNQFKQYQKNGLRKYTYLDETNVEGSLPEALPTHIEVIFTNDRGGIGYIMTVRRIRIEWSSIVMRMTPW